MGIQNSHVQEKSRFVKFNNSIVKHAIEQTICTSNTGGLLFHHLSCLGETHRREDNRVNLYNSTTLVQTTSMRPEYVFIVSVIILIFSCTPTLVKCVDVDANITFHTYVEQRAATSACSHQAELTCSALLFAERDHALRISTVSAGYLIFTDEDSPLVPDNLSRRSVAQTTTADATAMAHSLATSLVASYPAALCGVTELEVASAIWHAARVASECPDTDDPGCFPFYKLRVCDIPKNLT